MGRLERRLLITTLQGVSLDDLTAGATPWLAELARGPGGARRLHARTGLAGVDQLLDHLPVDELRSSGVALELRSVVLRASWQGDASVIRLLLRRAHGPADVTLLWLCDAARAAATVGLGAPSHRDALGELERSVHLVERHLAQDGTPLDHALLTFAPLELVTRSVDPVETLRRALPARLFDRLVLCCRPSHLAVTCPSAHATGAVLEALVAPELSAHGRVLTGSEKAELEVRHLPQELVLVAHDGVAFSAEPVRAAPRYIASRDRTGCAALPWLQAEREDLGIGQACRAIAEHVRSLLAPVEADVESEEASAPVLAQELLDALHSLPTGAERAERADGGRPVARR